MGGGGGPGRSPPGPRGSPSDDRARGGAALEPVQKLLTPGTPPGASRRGETDGASCRGSARGRITAGADIRCRWRTWTAHSVSGPEGSRKGLRGAPCVRHCRRGYPPKELATLVRPGVPGGCYLWACRYRGETQVADVAPSPLTVLLKLASTGSADYVVGGADLAVGGPDREVAAQMLAEDAMALRCGISPALDRWRQRRDGGPSVAGAAGDAVRVYASIGFGLPSDPANDTHLQGLVAELLWNRLLK